MKRTGYIEYICIEYIFIRATKMFILSDKASIFVNTVEICLSQVTELRPFMSPTHLLFTVRSKLFLTAAKYRGVMNENENAA